MIIVKMLPLRKMKTKVKVDRINNSWRQNNFIQKLRRKFDNPSP